MPGVEAVLAAPGFRGALVVLAIVGGFALLAVVGTLLRREWLRAVVSAVVLAACVTAGVHHLGPRMDDARRVYDTDATWRAVEDRYGVTLAQTDKDALDLRSHGYRRGARGIVTQRGLTGVVDASGTVRDDLFLQVGTSYPVRLAVVTKPAGVNELVATTGTWWPELPVLEDVRR